MNNCAAVTEPRSCRVRWGRTAPFRRPLAGLCCLAIALHIAFAAAGGVDLQDVTSRTGITFRHTDGSSGKHYIVEYVCAGLAVFDYDGDGDDDIYFLNGAPLRGTSVAEPPRNALYRNDGGWKFTDVTRAAGVGDPGHGLGVVAGDCDNDGDLDLYLNNFGPNVLYRNDGDGTFTDVTEQAGVRNGDRVGAGTCFLDIDADGDLDLYVANYVQFTYALHVERTRMGFQVYPSPRDYAPDPDTLYRNNGDGTFTDITEASGIGAHPGPSMGMVCADYDNDGDTDIFVGNDVEANFLFRNDGKGRFEEVGAGAGFAYDFAGLEHGSMGVECGDYDNDGLLDFHVTSYQQELATLYRNLGGGLLEDVTLRAGAGDGTRRNVTWGNGLVDIDNDGDRDLFIACGHLDDFVHEFDTTAVYEAENCLLLNNGQGRFSNVSAQAGSGMRVRRSSRGAGFSDFDGDGDLDVVVLNSRREPTLLRNDTSPLNHWLGIRLRGTRGNTFGVGARVRVVTRDLTQVDEVHAGRGYQGHYGLQLHFGLGQRESVQQVEVRWMNGDVDIVRGITPDRVVTVTQGQTSAPP